MISKQLMNIKSQPIKILLLEVEINPFRKEYFITHKPQEMCFQTGEKLIVQCEKEVLLGTLTKTIPFSEDLDEEKIATYLSTARPIHNLDEAPTIAKRFCRIVRRANEEDIKLRKTLGEKLKEYKSLSEKFLEKLKITAKIIYLDHPLNQNKLYLYLVAPQKINHQLLFEMLSTQIKIEVVIKQIGSRDYARSLGGIGICGREICCRGFLKTIPPVTLSKVRLQNIVLEPEKISGVCSKLRCCLLYELPQEKNNKNYEKLSAL
jgi:cell fate regulator YaaT (PSP1 superfamily)